MRVKESIASLSPERMRSCYTFVNFVTFGNVLSPERMRSCYTFVNFVYFVTTPLSSVYIAFFNDNIGYIL